MRAVGHSGMRPFAAPRSQQQRGPRVPPTARLGGGGGGGGNYGSDPRNQGLILPGQNGGSQRGGGRLVVPGQGGGTAPKGSGGSLVGAGMPSQQRDFRPPPGFMDNDDAGAVDASVAALPTDEMLNRLRNLTGQWHQLAKLLPALQAAGFDGWAVEEETGLERKIQNVWHTAVQVYESIKAPGLLPPGALEHFDTEGEELLYELRFLSIKQRAPAAAYIAFNNLSPHESQVLARAIKEHERRDGKREGFSDTPGDVLAYKHYRDAMEGRRKGDIEAAAKRGLAVAETEMARAKLTEMLGDKAQDTSLPAAILTVLRMAREELGFRPLAVAGSLENTYADDVLRAPKVASEGIFGNFRVPANGTSHEWVALPNWSVVTLAVHPIALTVADCGKVDSIRLSSSAKTEDEFKRMSGPGVVVVDIGGDCSVSPSQWYLVADENSRVGLAPGVEASAAARVLGPVLLLARPPNRETPAATTSELMSV